MPIFANNGALFIMAITKAVIAVIIVGSMAYCLIMQIPIPDKVIEVILLIVGVYFGYSAKVYHESRKNKATIDAWLRNRNRKGRYNARE